SGDGARATVVGGQHQQSVAVIVTDVDRKAVVEELHQLLGLPCAGQVHGQFDDTSGLLFGKSTHGSRLERVVARPATWKRLSRVHVRAPVLTCLSGTTAGGSRCVGRDEWCSSER